MINIYAVNSRSTAKGAEMYIPDIVIAIVATVVFALVAPRLDWR